MCLRWFLGALLLPSILAGKKKSPVLILTAGEPNAKKGEKDLAGTLRDGGAVVVNFNSLRPGCKACLDIEPEFKKAAKKLKKRAVVGAVDTDLGANAHVKGEYNVTSTPTLVLFRDGLPLSKLEGFKSAADIELWVSQADGPAVEVFETQKDFDKAMHARKRTETMFTAIGGPGLKDLLSAVAIQGHRAGWGSKIRYLFWSDGGRGRPFGAIHRGVNEMVEFDPTGEITTDTLEKFIENNHMPDFAQASMGDFSAALGQGEQGSVFVCFDPANFEAQVKKYAKAFQKAAKKWQQFGFSYLDVRDGMASILNVECKDFPSAVFKPVMKPFGLSYTKSWARPGEEPSEKSVNQFLKQSFATHKQKAEL